MKKSTRKKQPTEDKGDSPRNPQPTRNDEGPDQPGLRHRRRPDDMPRPDRDPDETPEPGRTPSGQDEE